MKSAHLVVLCTTPNRDTAQKIADTLVGRKLCACVNVVGGVLSTFFWKSEVCREEEVLLIIKTSSSIYEELEQTIKEIHPYELPEIIALPIVAGDKEYLEWIDKNTNKL